jgi:hypothetical protein
MRAARFPRVLQGERLADRHRDQHDEQQAAVNSEPDPGDGPGGSRHAVIQRERAEQ